MHHHRRNEQGSMHRIGILISCLAVLLVSQLVIAQGPPNEEPPTDEAVCSGFTLVTNGDCEWIIRQFIPDPEENALPFLRFGCFQVPAERGDIGIGGRLEIGSFDGEGSSPSIGFFFNLEEWDLLEGVDCTVPTLASLPDEDDDGEDDDDGEEENDDDDDGDNVLICWNSGNGTLCGRAYRVTDWQGHRPVGVLSDPMCITFSGPEDRARAEADLLAHFANSE